LTKSKTASIETIEIFYNFSVSVRLWSAQSKLKAYLNASDYTLITNLMH